MNGPHSRACGIRRHDHGPDCHTNCPTCGGVVTFALQAPCGAYMGPSAHDTPHWCKEEADHDGNHLCGTCRVQWSSATTTPSIHEDTPDPYQGASS